MREKISGIYMIKNLINDKIYIGKSVNIKKRWYAHKRYLKQNNHQNSYLQRSWNKYGKENFIFKILNTYNVEDLNIKEKYYIKKFNSNNYRFGYNTTDGGENFKVTDAKKLNQKHSQNNKPILQFDLNGNIVNRWYGISEAGSILGVNTRNIRYCLNFQSNRKTAHNYIWLYEDYYILNGLDLGYHINKETTAKSVRQYDLNNNLICTYDSAREAEEKTGVPYKLISKCCNGISKTSYGYRWEFAN